MDHEVDTVRHRFELWACSRVAAQRDRRAVNIDPVPNGCFDRVVVDQNTGDLTVNDAAMLLDRWCAWAQRCRLAPFVKLGRTIRTHRAGILATIEHGLTNGRVEGLNNRVRLIVRRAFGFHSANAALALVMLSCGPIELRLPHQHRAA